MVILIVIGAFLLLGLIGKIGDALSPPPVEKKAPKQTSLEDSSIIDHLRTELTSCQSNLVSSQSELHKLKQDNIRLRADYERLSVANLVLRNEIKKLRDVNYSDPLIEKYKKELSEANRNNSLLIEKHEKELSEVNKNNSLLIEEYKTDLLEANKKNTLLTRQVKTLQTKHTNYKEKVHNAYITLKEKIHNDLETLLYEKSQSKKWLASQIADFLTVEDEYLAEYLETKRPPAIKEGRRIREVKKEKKALIEQNKLLQYQIKELFSIFPELGTIKEFGDVELNQNIIDIADDETSDEERVKHWLTQEEFLTLSPSERNQRALDNYLKRNKSDWEIGKDFERYVGYQYEQKGYDITYFGIEKRLEDLGRDIIAENEKEILIIQCKYWSAEKLIREKHICQLFGTTVLYRITHNTNKRVIPLMVIHCSLSEEAKLFAKELHVNYIENMEIKPYPMIKCNIGKDEYGCETKIYHLPMDQQYDKVIIKPKTGECYCMTVKEAEKKGFRRAYRWHGGNLSG